MDPRLPTALHELALHQHGVLTRRQLLEGGLTPAQLRTRLGREWRLLLRGVVLLSNGVPSDQQRLVAALLFAGPRSWLAGPTAAAVHGIAGLCVSNPIHVLVPAPQRSRAHAWVLVRNTTLLDEPVHRRGPLRLSCPARAAVDAAAAAPSTEQARGVLVAAAQSRKARLSDLAHWTLARGQVGSRRLHEGLELAASGAWSVPEADLLRLLSSSTVLPPVWANPEVRDQRGRRLTTPDAWIDDVALAVMVHSRQWHADSLAWESTVEHDTDLQTARVVVVGVTPHSIAARPRWVLDRIEAAYLEARASGVRANVVATPHDPWSTGRTVPMQREHDGPAPGRA
ncbi:hypothetical protein [Terracoccus sp. 273MFTsu3.1]|uniref:hypothetical protein n=1 Tax=Terracoccus sp. 273MFTsu3.1 TaxID=1172188 RepID=UPI00036C8649|nr:hypothetical protein [Terracoccus sp. 273MFTsu3.1]